MDLRIKVHAYLYFILMQIRETKGKLPNIFLVRVWAPHSCRGYTIRNGLVLRAACSQGPLQYHFFFLNSQVQKLHGRIQVARRGTSSSTFLHVQRKDLKSVTHACIFRYHTGSDHTAVQLKLRIRRILERKGRLSCGQHGSPTGAKIRQPGAEWTLTPNG